jgi:hypothetical protein
LPERRTFTCSARAGKPVELNAATRDAVQEEWRSIAIIGKNAARDVYPGILSGLKG